MNVRWTAAAKQDRNDIYDFIALDNPDAAAGIDALFSLSAAKLGAFPRLGRTDPISGIRVLKPHKNYRLIYEIRDGCIWILALVHAARRWPPVA